MSVETLQRLHSRYTDLSSRFRAGWAFHQYAEGLRKIYPGDPQRPVVTEGFQAVYATLKGISAKLNADDADAIDDELDSVGERLRRLTAALAEEDNRVPPELVRQFFRRVKNEDENVLTQIVKFYLYLGSAGDWPADRLDKVDFLITRLAEERDAASDRFVLVESRRLFELANGFWSIVRSRASDEGPAEDEVERVTSELRSLRREVAAADALEDLNEGRLVERFRSLKHGLGLRFFHPRLLAEILETNLVFKNLVRELYSVEERRITADYQRVFDLEREVAVDPELDAELRSFREEVEGFERRLQRDELKLRELAHLRERIRSLSTRLTAGGAAGGEEEPARPEDEASGRAGEWRAGEDGGHEADDVLVEAIAHLDAALDEVPPDVPARRAVLGSALFGMRLEGRELEAHRRLRGSDGGGDPAVERTIFEAAAIRVVVNQQVEEIRALLDETAITGEAPVFARTRRTLRLANAYLGRLQSAAEQALLRGDTAEAQVLTLLRMRLTREHAGAWLLAIRPLLARQGSV